MLMAYFVFCILHIPVRNSFCNMFWRDTVMSKVLPSVVTASAIAWVTSSRLERGERKGKELLCVREIFHSVLKSMTSDRSYDPHLGTDSTAGYDAGYYF